MKKLIITLSFLIVAANSCAKPGSEQSKKIDATSDAKATGQPGSKQAVKLEAAVATALSGRQLSANQAAELEAAVAKDPNDLSARTKLLGYYFAASNTDDSKAAVRKHVLWIIKNRPEAKIAGLPECGVDFIQDPDGYQEAKQLWLDQTTAQPKSVVILDHAAKFFLIRDQTIAIKLLKQLQQLEPNNPKWSDKLGEFYTFERGKAGATKALEQFEKAQAADSADDTRFYRLDELTKAAFDAGEDAKAAQFADELLQAAAPREGDWNYGNAIHHANNTLGRIALKKGNTKTAAEYLLKADQTPGSPQLDSFGPNMSLAKELLEAGQRDSVLQYFELCRKFWDSHGEVLDKWANQVKAGEVPNFGANLVY
jgi:Flp pilus assembly protein TadD